MAWFKFFQKKTNPDSKEKSKDLEMMYVLENLGVLIATKPGKHTLILAPFWNHDLIPESVNEYPFAGMEDISISSLIVLNGKHGGYLPLEKILEINRIDNSIPIYFADLDAAEQISNYSCHQLPEAFRSGLSDFVFQPGTQFLDIQVERPFYKTPFNFFVGIDIRCNLSLEPEYMLHLAPDDEYFVWFIGNFDLQNPETKVEKLTEIGLIRKIKLFLVQDWIRANHPNFLKIMTYLGWEGVILGTQRSIDDEETQD